MDANYPSFANIAALQLTTSEQRLSWRYETLNLFAHSYLRLIQRHRGLGIRRGEASSMATGTGHRVEDIAHELFQVVTQICLSTLRGRRRAGDLKEVEFLTLSLLQEHGTLIVGDIQRVLGVLPAQ